MVEDGTDDMLAARVDALVNTVNTVGVMGKGLALAFKEMFPGNFKAYRRACEANEVVPGKMFMFDRAPREPRWIINFPTKRHWRDPSSIEDIRAGLVDLIAQIKAHEIRSIAVPALGCGLGGLAWTEVRPMIVDACRAIPSVRVLVFAPR